MEKCSLTATARQQLRLAEAASSGRSSCTVYGGHEHTLRETVIALAAGQELADHENPGEATVHVLHGRVRLTAGGEPAGGSVLDAASAWLYRDWSAVNRCWQCSEQK